MTSFPVIPNGTRALLSPIRFDGFDVSWAGASPHKDLFVFGSEDGRILFADLEGAVQLKAAKATPSAEAINGVAFSQRWMSVSTRNEVILWAPPQKPGENLMGTPIPFGSHGIIAGHSGYFLAPLGRGGLLVYQPKEGPETAGTVISVAIEYAYFYRVISLQAAGGQEIVACATRRGGVAAMEFKGKDQPHMLRMATYSDLDVVDLCPLGMFSAPEAAAAVGRDGTIILFRDVLRDSRPETIKYESIQGTAYRILSARGYLFLLTSEGMYVIAGLVERFLTGAAGNSITPVLALPMEAVDANLGSEHWVWIVMPDGVLRLDVELLTRITPTNHGHAEFRNLTPTPMTPDWHRQNVEQCSRSIPAGAVC